MTKPNDDRRANHRLSVTPSLPLLALIGVAACASPGSGDPSNDDALGGKPKGGARLGDVSFAPTKPPIAFLPLLVSSASKDADVAETSVFLANADETACADEPTVELLGRDGKLVESVMPGRLAGGQGARVPLPAGFTGSAVVRSHCAIEAVVSLEHTRAAGVPSGGDVYRGAARASKRLLFPGYTAGYTGQYRPRLAIMNPTPTSATVVVQIRNRDGAVSRVDTFRLGPHESVFRAPEYKESESFDGTAEVSADVPIAAVATTHQTERSTTAQLYAVPLVPEDDLAAEQVIPLLQVNNPAPPIGSVSGGMKGYFAIYNDLPKSQVVTVTFGTNKATGSRACPTPAPKTLTLQGKSIRGVVMHEDAAFQRDLGFLVDGKPAKEGCTYVGSATLRAPGPILGLFSESNDLDAAEGGGTMFSSVPTTAATRELTIPMLRVSGERKDHERISSVNLYNPGAAGTYKLHTATPRSCVQFFSTDPWKEVLPGHDEALEPGFNVILAYPASDCTGGRDFSVGVSTSTPVLGVANFASYIPPGDPGLYERGADALRSYTIDGRTSRLIAERKQKLAQLDGVYKELAKHFIAYGKDQCAKNRPPSGSLTGTVCDEVAKLDAVDMHVCDALLPAQALTDGWLVPQHEHVILARGLGAAIAGGFFASDTSRSFGVEATYDLDDLSGIVWTVRGDAQQALPGMSAGAYSGLGWIDATRTDIPTHENGWSGAFYQVSAGLPVHPLASGGVSVFASQPIASANDWWAASTRGYGSYVSAGASVSNTRRWQEIFTNPFVTKTIDVATAPQLSTTNYVASERLTTLVMGPPTRLGDGTQLKAHLFASDNELLFHYASRLGEDPASALLWSAHGAQVVAAALGVRAWRSLTDSHVIPLASVCAAR